MDSATLDHLKSLHTSAIDARNGYQEALEDAEGKGMTPLFRDMIALHEGNAAELARELTKANEIPDDKGSFMTRPVAGGRMIAVTGAVMLAILADPNGKLGSAMRSKWLMRLGGISYCVYLIHFPVNGILHSVLLGSRPSIAGLSGVSVTLLAAAVTVGLALLSWEYFEGPLLRLGHRYKYRLTTE